jgi:hypothetical protein
VRLEALASGSVQADVVDWLVGQMIVFPSIAQIRNYFNLRMRDTRQKWYSGFRVVYLTWDDLFVFIYLSVVIHELHLQKINY